VLVDTVADELEGPAENEVPNVEPERNGGAGEVVRLPQVIYDQIQSELRSQYVLSFYPPADAATKWHEVTVQVRGASAKTIRATIRDRWRRPAGAILGPCAKRM